MRPRVQLRGFDRVRRGLRELAPAHNRVRERGLERSMNLILDTAEADFLRGPRPRRLAPVTHALIRSLRIDDRGLPRRIEGGSPLVYAAIHEYGTRGRRAFLAPAFRRRRREIGAIFEREWAEEVHRVTRVAGAR